MTMWRLWNGINDDTLAREEANLRAMLGDVRPKEPSAEYWDSFAARVTSRVERERRADVPKKRSKRVPMLRPAIGFALMVAAVLLVTRTHVDTLDQEAALLPAQDAQALQAMDAPLSSSTVVEQQTAEELAKQAGSDRIDLDALLAFSGDDDGDDIDVEHATVLPDYDSPFDGISDDDETTIVAQLSKSL
jgi:hypothetical protein